MASLAWSQLGWELVAVAEVDPFASAVIAHHHPGVPNLGDISKITEEEIRALGRIDVVIGGFPCQDISCAGKRKGLRNDDGTPTRSGLFFDAMRLVRAADPRWLVVENVPGLFSSNEGRDFGAVLTEIVGCTFDIPRDGWQAAGACLGPRGALCWRTLDAQWFGLAQRRERVFFVADFGEGVDTAPLFPLLESVQGDPPACVAQRQRPPRRTSGRPRQQGIWQQIAQAFRAGAQAQPARLANALGAAPCGADDNEAQGGQLIPEIVPPLLAHQNRTGGHRQPGMDVDTAESLVVLAYGGNNPEPIDVATTQSAHGGSHGRLDFESETFVAHALRADGFDASEDGTGRGTPIIPFLASGAHGANGLGIGQPGDPAMTLDSTGAQAIAFSCKDDGRDVSDDLAPTLRSMNFDKSHANAGGQIAVAFRTNAAGQIDEQGDISAALTTQTDPSTQFIAFDTTQITSAENRCNPQAGDPCHPLASTAHSPALATLYEVRRLMPTECEALMGVWRNYTAITYRGKPAADGPRYKVLGNGFAVPCILWIGRQLELAASTRI